LQEVPHLGFIHPLTLSDLREPPKAFLDLFCRNRRNVRGPLSPQALKNLFFGWCGNPREHTPGFVAEFDSRGCLLQGTCLVGGQDNLGHSTPPFVLI
jgi:hypothetical protein